ncbi:hypothetical protein J4439_03215 [Candidatus Woesearchaeota archaeon]|nr:hypothetical protein [Candidatus Woesearchaeota archaeon]
MNILTLVPFDGFVPIMTGIVKGVYRDTGEKKICYISLNKPCKALIATLQGEGLDSTRFHIIDAVTKMAVAAPKPIEGCSFVSSPAALSELYATFSQLIEQEDYGALILDSVSTILVYEHGSVVIKFLHMIITKASLKGCHGAFICLKEDMDKQLLRELNMIVDVVRDYAKDMPMQEASETPPAPARRAERKPGFLERLFGRKNTQR